MKYNYETLIKYCIENSIQLKNDYKKVLINRESYIEGICITNNCCIEFNKNFRQLLKTGAYCKNCMTNIANKKIRESKVKYDINILTGFCKENNIELIENYSDKFVNRDTIIKGKCIENYCNNIFSKPFREILKLNGYCSDCSKELGKIKIKETNLERYGVTNVMKNETIKQKFKQSLIDKYGVEHVLKLETVKQQIKIKILEKYNVEHALQNPEIREKIKQTNLERYGVENPQQNIEVRNKTCNTNLKKYGVKYFWQTEDCKNKIIKTNLEKYGVHHHSQNPIVSEKMLKNAYKIKSYEMPSGKIVNYQGYENFMLDHLLLIEKVCEEDIINNRKDVPEIWFHDKNGKKRRHFVDFYIKSQNRCIEVKSIWTHKEKNFVLEKQESAKNLGYKYEIWIFDNKGNILETII